MAFRNWRREEQKKVQKREFQDVLVGEIAPRICSRISRNNSGHDLELFFNKFRLLAFTTNNI